MALSSAPSTESGGPPIVPGNRRPDIQGLRAIAVVMVVAFHAGLPLPGGFVGVDVFFVISGFVITQMLHREWLATGRIRFKHFYIRRFKRLTPALALVVVVTMGLSALVLSPLGPQQTASMTAIGAMFLSANFVITGTTGDYFDLPAATNPLLNTWSLSVEEQFYLVFPAILAIVWYLRRRTRRLRAAPLLIVGFVALASFGAALMNSVGLVGPKTYFLIGFYGPLSRAWEFAVGALLALALARCSRPIRLPMRALALIGAACLVVSLWIITESTPFPGPWTLLPVTGTLLLILAGSDGPNFLTSGLSVNPLVKVGDWSYSVYLWHWPLIVFATSLWPMNPYVAVFAAVASFLPALASYRWLERPIRSLRTLSGPRTLALILAIAVPPIAISAAVGLSATFFWEPRYATGSIPATHDGDLGHQVRFGAMKDRYFPCSIEQREDQNQETDGMRRCLQSKPGMKVDVALLGDSHAEHLFLGLAEELPDLNIMYVYLHGWPSRSTANSALTFAQVSERVSIRSVIVTAHWAANGALDDLVPMVKELVHRGKNVYLTDDVPDFPGLNAFSCKYRTGLLAPTNCSRDAAGYHAEQDSYMNILESIRGSDSRVRLLQTAKYFCSESTCSMTQHERLMYEDSEHLNSAGSRYVAQRLIADYPEVLGAFGRRDP